ncbi:BICD family-like cargo adapter 2 isoform X1 [Amblyraja radiata]|uniref:BICD family-like cargo adapter 2 isoform X1 n=1 Tax=Amblyraja radiata TaxID=386614 RepID=UPI00140416B0|nr:BICD family-like cargo adapter 2 isoform X1 [Amblyraja radiata]
MSAHRGLKPEGVWPALEENFLAFPLGRRDAYTPRPGPGWEQEEEAERLKEALRRRGQELFLIVELARALAEKAGQLGRRMEPPEWETEGLPREERELSRRGEGRSRMKEPRVHTLESELRGESRGDRLAERGRPGEERPDQAQISGFQESRYFQKFPERSRRELETPERPGSGQQGRVQEGDSAEFEELQEPIQDSDPLRVLQQAIHSRDEAIRKKRELERELEQVRDERDSLSRQLITTVRHKARLSQELEDWQEDVQTILRQQLQTQHGQERRGESLRGGGRVDTPSPSQSPRDHRGLLSLFRKL